MRDEEIIDEGLSEGIYAYIGLGSNLGERRQQIQAAVEALGRSDGILRTRVSTLIETEPVGTEKFPATGGAYINGAVEVVTTLSPYELLKLCLDIERSLGRIRNVKNEARTIDLDILIFGDQCVFENQAEGQLQVPHPRLHERAFVLEPLVELNPTLRHPHTQVFLTSYLKDLKICLRPEES